MLLLFPGKKEHGDWDGFLERLSSVLLCSSGEYAVFLPILSGG